MTTDVSSHGSGLLLGMLHMPTLVSTTASDSPVMLSAAAAAAEAYSQPAPGATSSGTGDSHMDAVHADAAAAHLLESQAGLSLETQEAALNQLKKACKAAKCESLAPNSQFESPDRICATAALNSPQLHAAGAELTPRCPFLREQSVDVLVLVHVCVLTCHALSCRCA